jgi:competence protein ComEC
MSFSDFPFLRYLPFLVLGVLLSQNGAPISVGTISALIGLCLASYGFLVFRKKDFNRIFPAFLAYAMLVLVGVLFSKIQGRAEGELLDEKLVHCESYLARVEKHDVPKPNSNENLLEVIQVRDSLGWHPSKGKVLIYHKGKSSLLPGQVIWVDKSPETIPPPIFPDEFDYRGYLARKDILYRQFIGEKYTVVDSSAMADPKYWLLNTRKKLAEVIVSKVPDPHSQQIATALLLGQKDNLDREIRSAYTETGTMHILAVSGLHVGIIYAILLFPLSVIQLKPQQKKIYLTTVILLIWTYAVLTGLSPSVVRAATMFSLFTAGQMRARRPSSWNILCFSAMLMIVINPSVIYDVGFQLSYLAVGGILLLQPLILPWWLPSNRVLEYLWQLTAVSLAAQFATFPLSILYFHIFPNYFLIANLVIIPLSFLVMNSGILMLALSWVPWVGDGLGRLVNWLIWLQNWITQYIQQLPGGSMERLTISFSAMALIWGTLIIWADWQWGDRKKLVMGFICLYFIWSTERLIREIYRPAKEMIIFSAEKGLLIDLTTGYNTHSWNEDLPPEQITFSIEPNRIAQHRAQFPVPLVTLASDGSRWFPDHDFHFSPPDRRFVWGKTKPVRIERISRSGSEVLELSDSLFANNGAFRIVF